MYAFVNTFRIALQIGKFGGCMLQHQLRNRSLRSQQRRILATKKQIMPVPH